MPRLSGACLRGSESVGIVQRAAAQHRRPDRGVRGMAGASGNRTSARNSESGLNPPAHAPTDRCAHRRLGRRRGVCTMGQRNSAAPFRNLNLQVQSLHRAPKTNAHKRHTVTMITIRT